MNDFFNRTLTEHAEALRLGEYSSRELTERYLARLEQTNQSLNAFLHVTAETALCSADASDARRVKGECLGLLDGIPFAIKDNICTKDIPTTCASRMLTDYKPPYDATVVQKLTAEGAVLLGKLNMDEFAMGSSGRLSAFGPTLNPLDPSRVTGGSSGGSAAAVAAAQAVFTLGSDTGGSVRQPAAFCGVVGIKPTYGRISRYGLVAFAPSLDQIGVLTRSVADNAAVLERIVGKDPRDATSANRLDHDFSSALQQEARGLRIAVVRELIDETVSSDVRNSIQNAVERLRQLGATVSEISIPVLTDAAATYYLISCAEASSTLARFDGIRFGYRAADYATIDELYRRSRSEGFGYEVKRRILLGTFVLSDGYADAYYKQALRIRAEISRQLTQVLEHYDLLLGPTTPNVAYRLDETPSRVTARRRDDTGVVLVNLAGLPAISIPYGQGEGGMPIGVQLIGNAFDERTLYRAAHALEIDLKQDKKNR